VKAAKMNQPPAAGKKKKQPGVTTTTNITTITTANTECSFIRGLSHVKPAGQPGAFPLCAPPTPGPSSSPAAAPAAAPATAPATAPASTPTPFPTHAPSLASAPAPTSTTKPKVEQGGFAPSPAFASAPAPAPAINPKVEPAGLASCSPPLQRWKQLPREQRNASLPEFMNRLASPEEAEDKSKSQVGPMEAWGAELMKRQREREMQETRESARESARRERAEMKRHWTFLSTPAFATGPEPKKPSIESQAERK
jgi:hypothetical protein